MAASDTVPQGSSSLNSSLRSTELLRPSHGVIALTGYGIRATVDRGHLTLADGIGARRLAGRLPRVGHGLRRLVVVGSDGMISLAALRWIVDQRAAFVLLDRDGTVLATAGRGRAGEARLRRAQALALHTGTALPIIRALIDQKIAAQERTAREQLRNTPVADELAAARPRLQSAQSPEAARLIEAQAGQAYWSAWRVVPVVFPQKDLPRVPEHWRIFGARRSPISGSQRLAINPPNAMLNYLYAVLESEARLAASLVGLDPSMGLLHADTGTRDSLACDLMEPVRPQIDAYVLDWLTRTPFRREWFFEQRDGSCRLMARFAKQLAETSHMWAHAVAPVAERVAAALWATVGRAKVQQTQQPTPLTQRNRRGAKGQPAPRIARGPSVEYVCRACGVILTSKRQHCLQCERARLPQSFAKVLKIGRASAHTAQARAKLSATQRRHNRARAAWNPTDCPAWLTPDYYAKQIQPRLVALKVTALEVKLGVSKSYAAQIRAGKRVPHLMHWSVLARLVGTQG